MDQTVGLSPRARVILPILLVALVFATVHRLVCAPVPGPYMEFAGPTMGTTYSVKLAAGDLDAKRMRVVSDAIMGRLEAVNQAMSTWIPTSELMRFNGAPVDTPFPASLELRRVLQVAADVSRRSGGAFDVTVAPLVALWGFGAEVRPDAPAPSEAAIEAGLRRIGWQQIAIDEDTRTITRKGPGIRVDLSAIAKGFAVDEVARALRKLGYEDWLVEVGGELRASGHRRDGRAWRVAIERPTDGPGRSPHLILELDRGALATSGDYRNFYERDGRRISHTIDPRDGRPISHDLASVSVVHEDAVHADAWATALNVLGPTEGYTLAVNQGLAAYFIERDPEGSESGFRTRETPAFETLAAITPAPPIAQPSPQPSAPSSSAAPPSPESGADAR